MDKKRIGIYYYSSDNWIGGKYYFDSLINVLKLNPNNEIIYIKYSKYFVILKILGKLFGKNNFLYKFLYEKKRKSLNLDIIFPYTIDSYSAKKRIFWIPDFQENYYPNFFSIDEISGRVLSEVQIAYSQDTLILSSESAKKDFKRLFPKHNCEIKVVQFISSLFWNCPKTEIDILKEYNIDKPFFICSNQFWQHKNHAVVVNAMRVLMQKNIDVLCIFTGKENDYRNPDYPKYIKDLIIQNNLENNIRSLGFISRAEQIELMKHSVAIIQPSLFEGWNTTIEDAKFLNKSVIASSLDVHKEQLNDKGYYFDVDDYNKLAELCISLLNIENTDVDYGYNKQVQLYIKTVNEIFN